jgi:hypothetical protein
VFGIGPATKIYLALGATDMRKGFEGLYGLVRDRLQLEPLSGSAIYASRFWPFESPSVACEEPVGNRVLEAKICNDASREATKRIDFKHRGIVWEMLEGK